MASPTKRKCSDEGRNDTKKKHCRSWEESFAALKAYKEMNGNCNVPAKYPEDQALGRWVVKNRSGAAPNVTIEQHNRLTELGFDWETLEERIEREWNLRYQRLKQFRMLNGHCELPTRSIDALMKPWSEELGTWVARQKLFYRKDRLKPDKIAKLKAIGFQFSRKNAQKKEPDSSNKDKIWMAHYFKLQDFQKEHGHCLVTLSHPDKPLFFFVKAQRENYARNDIRIDRQGLLEELNFNWKSCDKDSTTSHHQQHWEDFFRSLQEFKGKHGHVDVPRHEIQLSNWLDHQKTYWRRGQLPEWRANRLKSIGVDKEKRRKAVLRIQIRCKARQDGCSTP